MTRNFEAFERHQANELEEQWKKEFGISDETKEEKVNPTEDFENEKKNENHSIETVIDEKSYGKDLSSTLDRIKTIEELAKTKNPPLSDEEIEGLLEWV